MHSENTAGESRRWADLVDRARFNALIVRRRARRDFGLLAVILALMATAAMLAVAAPRLVLTTVDSGAAEIVSQAGSAADVVLAFPVDSPAVAFSTTDNLPEKLPPALAAVTSSTTLTVIGGASSVQSIDGAHLPAEVDNRMTVALLTPEISRGVTVIDGRLPEATDKDAPIEIALAGDAALAADLQLGSGLSIRLEDRKTINPGEIPPDVLVTVVGIIEPTASSAAEVELWEDSGSIWAPSVREDPVTDKYSSRITVIAAPAGVELLARRSTTPFEGIIRLHSDPQSFTAALVPVLTNEFTALSSDPLPLTKDGAGPPMSLQSHLVTLLGEYPAQARAALAQMSVMIAGVLGIAAAVIVLLSRLLVTNREAALALERARGSSVVGVGLRALLESIVLTSIATVIGVFLAWLVIPGEIRDPLPLIAVAVVAMAAVPVQSMLAVRRAWTGRREPANRRDRAMVLRGRATRRIVLEGAIIVIAGAALVSLRSRGLLQTRTDGIDPFLAAAPLLLVLAATIVVLRIYPYPVRAVSSLGRRSRGPLGLLGAVRASAAIAVLPLLALTMGGSVAITGGLLVDTVRSGQIDASWQRLGADARIDGELSDRQEAALRSAVAVSAVSTVVIRGGVGLDLGTRTTDVTVLAADAAFTDLVDLLPEPANTETLRLLDGAPVVEGRTNVVVDQATADSLISDDIAMYYGPRFLPMHVVGVTSYAPIGFADGPFIFVNFDALAMELPDPITATTTFVAGTGAEQAVNALALPEGQVITRTDWISARRDLALVSGVETTMIASAFAAALLAVVALVATVVSGARARGRALSMLRTLGMSPSLGWWLALAELAPLLVAAVIGSVGAGILVVVALAPALGLDVLAGGVGIPAATISPVVILSVIGGSVGLLAIGAFVEVIAHRRDKLSEVLRVGESV